MRVSFQEPWNAPASWSWRLSRTDPEAVRDMGSFPALLPLLPMPVKDLLTPALCTALVEACTRMTVCMCAMLCVVMGTEQQAMPTCACLAVCASLSNA